nr:MAG TPA: hypothetical protein [Caudoviricetes sp.]
MGQGPAGGSCLRRPPDAGTGGSNHVAKWQRANWKR